MPYTTIPKENEQFESMLKRFNKKCAKGDLFAELKERKHNIKKSVKKRKRKNLEKFAIKTQNFKILHKK